MADDALLPSSVSEQRAVLRDESGAQWVALPKNVRFEENEVVVRQNHWGVTIEARYKRRPRTAEECAAFWAKLDSLRGDDLLELPPREPWPDPERDW